MATTIPVEATSFVTTLQYLGFDVGPLKAFELKGDRIDAWFVPRGQAWISRDDPRLKRASGRLIEGRIHDYSRRAYMELRVQHGSSGEWEKVEDGDYVRAGLKEPWRYVGTAPLTVWTRFGKVLIQERAVWENNSWMLPANAEVVDHFRYYRHLPGDRSRALAKAELAAYKFIQKADEELTLVT